MRSVKRIKCHSSDEFDVHEFSIEWEIKNAKFHLINNNFFCTRYIDTDETCANTGKKFRWQLNTGETDFPESVDLSIKLNPDIFVDQPDNFVYTVQVKITLLNPKDNSILWSQPDSAKIFELTKNYPIIDHEDYLFDKSYIKSIIIDDMLTVKCRILTSSRINAHEMDSPHKKIKISNENQLSSDLSSLLSSEEFSDLTITTLSGDIIKAHKNILAARSEVFHRMLTTSMVEKIKSQIKMPDFCRETVRNMLQFLYSGNITLENKNMDCIIDLFKISHKYQLNGLKKQCIDQMASDLDLLNIVEILIVANLYDEDENGDFKSFILPFIKKNMKDLLKSPDFKNLNKTHPHIIAQLFFAINQES